jgi:cell division protein DivIC
MAMRFLKVNKFYLLSIGLFLAIVFLGRNNPVGLIKKYRRIQELEEEKALYEQRLRESDQERKSTIGTNEQIEKFGREAYLLKKENEDLYITVDENDELLEK